MGLKVMQTVPEKHINFSLALPMKSINLKCTKIKFKAKITLKKKSFKTRIFEAQKISLIKKKFEENLIGVDN